jgi:hypothetical protein
MTQGHGHEHGDHEPGHGHHAAAGDHGHTHGVVDPSIVSTDRGRWALNIRQNLFFAFVYNALGVSLAAGVLYPFFQILLAPIVASAAMTFSSVSVIVNALRLRRIAL